MVLFLLCIKVDTLENVQRIGLPSGHSYCLTVKDSAGEDIREGVYVTSQEQHELSGSKGTAHFRLKWAKDSRREANMNVVDVKNVTREYTADDERKFVPIIGFECRGLDPVDWRPEDGFVVTCNSGKVFQDVDLSEKEWADFDDKAGESVGIYGLEWKFETHR